MFGQSLVTITTTAPEQAVSGSGEGISWFCIAFGLAKASIGVGVLNYPTAYDKIVGIAIATYVVLALVSIIMLSMAVLIYGAMLFCSDLS